MSFQGSNSEDQLRLAELATARLERQSKRIIENDPTIPVSKLANPKTTRNKTAKQWLPLDYPDSSDGDMTSTGRASRMASPLDVHAKVFRPGSRESSLSRTREPPRKDSAYLGTDDGDFQLVTSKRTKPSSRSVVGLNAHEIKVDERPSAIAVPFNKHEINEVFGNDLPPLTFFQGTVGHQNGEVGFAMHPNGDISAQQWSQDAFQWYNIGQFSNVRRRTEGSLASHRLKGENELQSLQQHTLSYFRAVALQHEASAMKTPFKNHELQAAMPRVLVERAAPKVASAPSAAETPTRSESEQGLLEKKKLQARTSSLGPDRHLQTQAGPHLRSQQKLSIPSKAPASSNLSFQQGFLPSALNGTMQSANAYDNSPLGLASLNKLSSRDPSSGKGPNIAESGSQPHSLKKPSPVRSSLSEHSQYLNSFLPKSVPLNIASQSQIFSPVPNLDFPTFLEKVQPPAASSGQATAQSQRNFTKACLDKIFDAATSRNINANTGTRTVLHDPFQNQPAKIVPVTPKIPMLEAKHHETAWSSTPADDTSSSNIGHASSSTSSDDAAYNLLISEPDYTPKSKSMEIVDISLPSMTTEELAIHSRPSPQNFDGPFFMGSPDVAIEASRKSHDQELHDWFCGGLRTIERQDEHFKYIKAAHYQTSSMMQQKAKPGPIGTPTAFSNPDKKRESETFNEVTTRVFLSVHESLSQYTQGPLDQRRGYLAPFCDPPEWCIDRSANGNKSFFGEDWGHPPERISRDSRYMPLPFESKFGAYNPYRGASVGGMHFSGGRLGFGTGLKY